MGSEIVGGGPTTIIAAITVFAGIITSSVSFQFYQLPMIVSSTIFPENRGSGANRRDRLPRYISYHGTQQLRFGKFWMVYLVVIYGLDFHLRRFLDDSCPPTRIRGNDEGTMKAVALAGDESKEDIWRKRGGND